MRYDPGQTGVLLRMAPATVEKIRAKAADLVCGSVDTWRGPLLAGSGLPLGRAAASGVDCLPPKWFFDLLDGRATWRGREDLQHHVRGCWHCIDHFCRLLDFARRRSRAFSCAAGLAAGSQNGVETLVDRRAVRRFIRPGLRFVVKRCP